MRKILIFIFSFFMLFSPVMNGQENDTEIIKRALHDELTRSMDSIANDSDDEPCFMSYTIINGKVLYANATLGALINSDIQPTLTYSSRLIVGDYHMNDENFNFRGNPENKYVQEIRMPRKADYWGIRRALWSSTERMYDNASKSYKAKKALLEDNNLNKEDYVLPDYSEAPVVKLHLPEVDMEFNKAYWENMARQVSSVFIEYPEIIASGTSLSLVKSTSHFLNSEGTEFSYPSSLISIEIRAEINDSNNVSVEKSISYTGKIITDIPTQDSLKMACHHLVKSLNDEVKREALKESYNGPVLFEGSAASDILMNSLFSYNGLIAQREALNSQGYEFRLPTEPENNSIEAKMGKKVVNANITVQSLSHLKEYKGQALWGNFEIDGEGVVPPAELTLIEKGILKTLLNSRVPSFSVQKSNGHNRINSLWGNILYPGVLKITSEESMEKNQLKTELIKIAKENGNDYCFIVRKDPHMNHRFVYKVNLDTGTEELINTGRISTVKMSDLKKKVIFSDQELAYNSTRGGVFTSVISPDALIINNINISTKRNNHKNKPIIVQNPISEL